MASSDLERFHKEARDQSAMIEKLRVDHKNLSEQQTRI
jgi:hypothetical protein